ncbi:hypothetical protein [Deferribacter autotrophicus]|nr:hypothetical protein [Deferribacter autotrophicus]
MFVVEIKRASCEPVRKIQEVLMEKHSINILELLKPLIKSVLEEMMLEER